MTTVKELTKNYSKFTSSQSSKIKISIRVATSKDLHQLCTLSVDWAREYNQSGGQTHIITKSQWQKKWSFSKNLAQTLVATNGTNIVGFILCKDGLPNEAVIDLCFVKKKSRSMGIATQLYKAAIDLLNARSIELTYARVLKKLAYWKSLGFCSVAPTLGQDFTMRGLCVLQFTSVTNSPLLVPLEDKKLRRYMKSMQRNMIYCHYMRNKKD